MRNVGPMPITDCFVQHTHCQNSAPLAQRLSKIQLAVQKNREIPLAVSFSSNPIGYSDLSQKFSFSEKSKLKRN